MHGGGAPLVQLGTFLASLCTYHVADYLLHNRHNPEPINFNTCLCSSRYLAALALSLGEYYLEYAFFPWKRRGPLVVVAYCIGLAGMVLGDGMRKLAMLQNPVGFTHKITLSRRHDHHLVTSGMYRVVRHPGYLGWLIWAVSTQIMLANPVSMIAFFVSAWVFFRERVLYEEDTLLLLFGQDYLDYIKRTRRYIPFIPDPYKDVNEVREITSY